MLPTYTMLWIPRNSWPFSWTDTGRFWIQRMNFKHNLKGWYKKWNTEEILSPTNSRICFWTPGMKQEAVVHSNWYCWKSSLIPQNMSLEVTKNPRVTYRYHSKSNLTITSWGPCHQWLIKPTNHFKGFGCISNLTPSLSPRCFCVSSSRVPSRFPGPKLQTSHMRGAA